MRADVVFGADDVIALEDVIEGSAEVDAGVGWSRLGVNDRKLTLSENPATTPPPGIRMAPLWVRG